MEAVSKYATPTNLSAFDSFDMKYEGGVIWFNVCQITMPLWPLETKNGLVYDVGKERKTMLEIKDNEWVQLYAKQ